MSRSPRKPTNTMAETVVRLMAEVEHFSEQIEKNTEMMVQLNPLATWEDWPDQDAEIETPNV
jgi:hypothetical protein